MRFARDMSSFLVWSLAFVITIIWVISIVDIVRHRTSAVHAMGWILLVVLFPVVGSIVYWVTRKPTAAELEATAGAEADLAHGQLRDRSRYF